MDIIIVRQLSIPVIILASFLPMLTISSSAIIPPHKFNAAPKIMGTVKDKGIPVGGALVNLTGSDIS